MPSVAPTTAQRQGEGGKILQNLSLAKVIDRSEGVAMEGTSHLLSTLRTEASQLIARGIERQ